jgi:hypothetical protein
LFQEFVNQQNLMANNHHGVILDEMLHQQIFEEQDFRIIL